MLRHILVCLKPVPENLADVLAHHVLTPEVRRSAEEMSTRVAAEDGLNLACDLIARQLAEGVTSRY